MRQRHLQPATSVSGILPEHLLRLKNIMMRYRSVIVIRVAKQKSLQHIGNRSYVSKPYEVKMKTDPESGLVKFPNPNVPHNAPLQQLRQAKPPKGMSPEEWNDWIGNWEKLQGRGYKFNSEGFLENPQGQMIFSDYDIMGKYIHVQRRDTVGRHASEWKYDDTVNTRNGIGQLNQNVVGHEGAMFRHAGQDSWNVYDPKTNWFKPGLEPKDTDLFLVVDENGSHFNLKGTSELQDYYRYKGIEWPYGKKW